jgi:hypothetical protein
MADYQANGRIALFLNVSESTPPEAFLGDIEVLSLVE